MLSKHMSQVEVEVAVDHFTAVMVRGYNAEYQTEWLRVNEEFKALMAARFATADLPLFYSPYAVHQEFSRYAMTIFAAAYEARRLAEQQA
jgi:hypothetical protein